MKEWIAISISAATLLVVLVGGVWYAGHQDQQLATVVEEVQEHGDTLDRVDRQVAWIAGHLGILDDSFASADTEDLCVGSASSSGGECRLAWPSQW